MNEWFLTFFSSFVDISHILTSKNSIMPKTLFRRRMPPQRGILWGFSPETAAGN
jgi:hypothetical protein